jgi:agmatinase
VSTSAVFFPFDLFGSAGAANGADALYDALRELLAANRRERVTTRSRAYDCQVRLRRFPFEKLDDYRDWRKQARQTVRRALQEESLLLWVAGNHLGVLPVYEELGRLDGPTLVVQFDAHLDIHHFTECSPELSHGNFLLHSEGPLPTVFNVGHRDLLLPPEHVARTYKATFAAMELAVNPAPALRRLRRAAKTADRVFLDLDCDVFDPAHFPAVSNPVPFGLDPLLFLKLLDAAWSGCVAGFAISEFDPGCDRDERSLALLVWLIEYVLLKRYEIGKASEG